MVDSVERGVLPREAVAADLERHRSYLMRVARLQLRDEDLAEDVVQDTMLAALKTETFTGASTLRTWLTSILRHKIIDAIRRRQKQAEVSESSRAPSDSDSDDFEPAFDEQGEWRTKPAGWGDPEQALRQREFLEVVSACMEHLSPRVARVFIMREYMELEVAEICRELDLTAGNVHVILHRARMGLRQCVEKNWIGKP